MARIYRLLRSDTLRMKRRNCWSTGFAQPPGLAELLVALAGDFGV